MHIVYFLTYGYSLKTWQDSGNLDRELKFMEYLNINFNHTFTLITYGDEDDELIVSEYEFIKVLPAYSYIKKSSINLINYFTSLKIPFSIKKLIGNFDLIQQNQLHGSWISILFKLLTKKPLYTRTGYDMYLFSIFEKKKIYKRFLYYILTQITIYFTNSYSVTSHNDLEFLKSNFRLKEKKLSLIRNWIEISNDINLDNKNTKELLCVGRLEYQKNYEYLINSFSNSEFKIVIYGSGSLLNDLKKQAEEKNTNVEFRGVLEYSELQEIYKQHHFYLSSSLYEGNPKSLIESMNAGCIPIVSKIINNIEIVNSDVGILFDFKDDIQKKIIDLLENKEEMSRLSNNAKLKVIDDYSIEKIGVQTDQIFKNTIRN